VLSEGKGYRPFHRADVGGEKSKIGVRERLLKRIFLACLPESDSRIWMITSLEEVHAVLETYSMVAIQDDLRAQLHTGFAIVKAIPLIPQWRVASFDQIKVWFGISGTRPSHLRPRRLVRARGVIRRLGVACHKCAGTSRCRRTLGWTLGCDQVPVHTPLPKRLLVNMARD